MAREIKFRAWCEENKKYYYTDREIDNICFNDDGTCNIYHYPTSYHNQHPCIAMGCIPEQYTGLKDKNNKPIFEGDIVTWSTVEYSEYKGNTSPKFIKEIICKKGCFQTTNGCKLFNFAKDDMSGILNNIADLEIIGNIHENPELIEGGE